MTNVVIPIPRLWFNKRQSNRTANIAFKTERRSHSIPISRISPREPPFIMSHTIDISISLRDLLSTDSSLSRVTCVLWDNDTESEKKWRILATSKPVNVLSSRRLDFEEKIRYQYIFEKTQLIKVDICRYHDGITATSSDDVIGSCIFKVDELIGSFGLQLRRSLFPSISIGSVLTNVRPAQSPIGGLFISAEMPEKDQPIVVQLHGRALDRKDLLWDETAVFFRVFRLEEGKNEDSLVLLYESEAIKNHSHPQWGEFRLGAHEAADNRNRLLEVWVMYRDVDGSEGYIGKFLTTYAKMKYGPGPDNMYSIINESKKQHKKNYEHSGKMELVKFTDVSFYSFLDYIVSGTQLHFEIAVDFSCEDMIHELDQHRFDGDVQMAVRAIGGILRDYTPNRLFPAFGIGAKIPPTFHESHEFHLNFHVDSVCRGLDGVMEAFKKAQAVVSPLKTAKFAPIINNVIRMSHRSGFRGLHYHILTIFTRGALSDIKEVQSALTAASEAPLSVLFIGVGDGDFSQLHKLVSKRKDGQRQCVQLVCLKDILNASDSPFENKTRIAENALRAIPQHMTDYMHTANIAAKPPIQVCRSPLFHSSSLIPDRPTQFPFDTLLPPLTPNLPRSRQDRRGSDSQYLDVELGGRNCLTVRIPERSHSVLQTTKEQYQRRLKERGLAKMRFPRIELSTLESSGSTQDSSL